MRDKLRIALFVIALWSVSVLILIAALLLLGYFGFLLAAGLLATWAGHTLASQRVCDDMELALMRAGVSDKEAAYTMGITPQQWANQKAGDEMASLWRAADLPVAVWVEFAKLRLERLTAGLYIERAEIAMLVDSVRELARSNPAARREDKRVA